MSENIVEIAADNVEMNNSEISFDNLVILKEFSNIVDLVRNEDFLETVPKAKLRRVKWVPMFNYLKQRIFDEMVQSITVLWKEENMPKKLYQLEEQKEKLSEINNDRTLWRPQLGDVKAQLRACDMTNLEKQKALLESLAKEYEARVNKLKKTVSAKRGYLKVLQMDIQKYQKKNEEYIEKMSVKLENRDNILNIVVPDKVDVEELSWKERDFDLSD